MAKRISYKKMKEVLNEYLDEDIEFLETENKIYIYDFKFINLQRNSDFSKENIIDNHLAHFNKENENNVIENIERGFIAGDKFATAKLIIKFLNKYKDKFIFEEKFSYKKCKNFLEDLGFGVDKNGYISYEVAGGNNSVKKIPDTIDNIIGFLNKEEGKVNSNKGDIIYTLLKNNKEQLLED